MSPSGNPLTAKKCQPCEGGVAPLTRAAAQILMAQLDPQWRLSDDGKSLHREWQFRNFLHTMSFVNALAYLANREDHHPDLEIGYGYCRVRWSTHDVGGLSMNDFVCAAKVDALLA